jgi:hypothetical protein
VPELGWDAITAHRVDVPVRLVLVTGACALVAVAVDGVWWWTRRVVTIVHEGGHAVAALLTGRRLTGITLHADASGRTSWVGEPSGPGRLVIAAGGPLAPSLAGLAGVALLVAGQVTIMLWASTLILAGMLVTVRNLYGALSLVVSGAAVVMVSVLASGGVQSAFGYTITWFLLLGAVRPAGELVFRRRRHHPSRGDAHRLAHHTHVPAVVWLAVFDGIAVGALAAGGWLLLGSTP